MSLSRRGWGPALRIARRQVRRNLGRSALIAVLVGLPVAGATLVDVVYRTSESPERDAYRIMGDADAVVEVTAYDDLDSPYDGVPYFPNAYHGALPGSEPVRDPAHTDVATVLPEGSTAVPVPLRYHARLEHGRGTVRTLLDVGHVEQRMSDHWARLTAGRWPTADDEVVVTEALAERLGLLDDGKPRPEASVALDEGPAAKVTGVFLDPFELSAQRVLATPGTAVARHAEAELDEAWNDVTHLGGAGYLVDLPDGVDTDALWRDLAAQGIRLVPRDVVIDPDRYAPPDFAETATVVFDAQTIQAASLGALVVGLGLLEVVLLAGAAFAVGARRQVRELGLMAAGGATAAQIRRTVMAQGLVLGLLGAALGVVAGALLAVAGRPIWEQFLNEAIDRWSFGAAEIVVAAAVGLVSGLAAALVPAVGAARMSPVDALAQRFRATRLATRMPALGIGLLVIGAGGALVASRLAAGDLAAYSEQLESTAGSGLHVTAPNTLPYVVTQLTGAVVATAGLVIMLPGLISVIARAARGLGVSVRLAVRDAARHRHRTAPTVAAITIVVAGSTALAFGAHGAERVDELRYVPGLPADVIRIDVDRYELDGAAADETLAQAERAVAEILPDARVYGSVEPVVEFAADGEHHYEPIWISTGPCDCPNTVAVTGSAQLGVADPEIMALAAGRQPDERTLDAVEAGKIVVFDEVYVDDTGHVAIQLFSGNEQQREVRLPAHLVERDVAYAAVPGAFVSEEVAAQHGWLLRPGASFAVSADATADQVDTAVDAVELAGAWPTVESEQSGSGPMVLALSAGTAFVTVVGVAIAVSLAAVEGRADLATLAAVGAAPRRRRILAAAQALVVGGLGVLLGVGLGVYFAYLAWPVIGAPEFIWAWDSLILIGLAVPTLAVLVAVAVTPSRLPMVRRAG